MQTTKCAVTEKQIFQEDLMKIQETVAVDALSIQIAKIHSQLISSLYAVVMDHVESGNADMQQKIVLKISLHAMLTQLARDVAMELV